MEARSEHVHIARTFFARFGANLRARAVLRQQNFCVGDQSKSLLRVRCWLGCAYVPKIKSSTIVLSQPLSPSPPSPKKILKERQSHTKPTLLQYIPYAVQVPAARARTTGAARPPSPAARARATATTTASAGSRSGAGQTTATGKDSKRATTAARASQVGREGAEGLRGGGGGERTRRDFLN